MDYNFIVRIWCLTLGNVFKLGSVIPQEQWYFSVIGQIVKKSDYHYNPIWNGGKWVSKLDTFTQGRIETIEHRKNGGRNIEFGFSFSHYSTVANVCISQLRCIFAVFLQQNFRFWCCQHVTVCAFNNASTGRESHTFVIWAISFCKL